MLSVSTHQLETWIALFLWPAIRLLSLISIAPILGHRAVPRQVKVGLALLLAIVIGPLLPTAPDMKILSPHGLELLWQQMAIGISIGFSMRIVLAAIEFAGEVIGLQMGLSFAGFFDLQSNQGSNAVSSWLSMVATLLFLSLNGHLIMLHAVIDSFYAFPVGDFSHALFSPKFLVAMGAKIFSIGLSLALPMIAVMLFINISLGIIARSAPQLNIFAIGFPLTILVGLVTLLLSVPFLEMPLSVAIQDGLSGLLP
jgi:flagellar biosynthesis protein FliR